MSWSLFLYFAIFLSSSNFASYELDPDGVKEHCEAFSGEWKRNCIEKNRRGCRKFGQYYCDNRDIYQRKPIFLNFFVVDDKQWCSARSGIWAPLGVLGINYCVDPNKTGGTTPYEVDYERLLKLKLAGKKSVLNCCFCIFDKDESTQRECSTWMSESNCNKKLKIKKSEVDSLEEQNLTCHNSKIYGAQHSNTSRFGEPFRISSKIAEVFSSSSVCYDGSSCLVFNNINSAYFCALGVNSSKCDFSITGNQNIGVTQMRICPTGSVKEISESSSKLTFEVSKSLVKMQFHDCSNAGEKCGYEKSSSAEDNLHYPNTKECVMKDNSIGLQSCCLNREEEKGSALNGLWSEPNQNCEQNLE